MFLLCQGCQYYARAVKHFVDRYGGIEKLTLNIIIDSASFEYCPITDEDYDKHVSEYNELLTKMIERFPSD